MAELTKSDLTHLAELARIKLEPGEEEKFLGDLKKILDHFKELQELETADIPPMPGGTDLKNVWRGDKESEGTDRGAGVESFPESKDGYLKVPPVFEADPEE